MNMREIQRMQQDMQRKLAKMQEELERGARAFGQQCHRRHENSWIVLTYE